MILRIEFEYPSSLDVTYAGIAENTILVRPPLSEREHMIEQVEIEVKDFVGLSLNQYARSVLNEEKLQDNFTLLKSNKTNLDNNPAIELLYTYYSPSINLNKREGTQLKFEDIQFKQMTIFTIIDDSLYEIRYIVPSDRFNIYIDNVDNIIKTFHISDEIKGSKNNSTNKILNNNFTSEYEILENNELEILGDSYYLDTIGTLHLVGEVKNNSPSVAEFVKIIGTFYDNQGNVIATKSTYTDPSNISPNEKVPFELLVLDSALVEKITKYRLMVSWQ
ncbi:MAG TPA: FxLYD domain-containing protein [Nitrososphaeraceae archaeon]